MTQLRPWGIMDDPFDVIWKNFLDNSSNFTTVINSKINYPVDIYETENGLRFELAVVGLSDTDLDIQVDGDTLRIKYEKPEKEDTIKYLQKGIAKRSFNLGYKIASKFDLSKAEAIMENGLLAIRIPFAEEAKPKVLKIK